MNTGKKIFWPFLAAVAIAGGSYLGTIELNHNALRADTPAQTAKPTPPPEVTTTAGEDMSHIFRAVHNALKNAVVNIHIVKKISVAGFNGGLPEGFQLPPGFQIPPGFRFAPQGHQVEEGTGSGVIISPDGYILTNNHVVEGADDIEVTLEDGRKFKAKVVGTDPKTDLAVVRVTADHLTYAKFGDSDAMEVGDWVLAFGSPLGFSHSMTQGIISAKGRVIDIISEHNAALKGLTYEDFLQTDAAINPGNSGGPLVNLKGEVIGINAAIASNTGQYNGIGFAIPSNDAEYIMTSLIKNGKVVRGYLDVQIEDVNNPGPDEKALVDSIKKQGFTGKGVLVARLDPDGPAGKGGMESGDVITSINGKPADTVNVLRNDIARTAPGTKVTLGVFRNGKTLDLSFPVGTQPDTNPSVAAAGEGGVETPAINNKDLGISVQPLEKDLASKYKLKEGEGVEVTEVAPESLAANLGISVGDVITRVGGTAVNSPREFKEAMGKSKLSDGVRMSIRSEDGMDRTVFLMKK